MRSFGARLYGKKDIRVEAFELPPIREDEILVRVYADSLCMSTLKAATLASDHKRVPENLSEHPVLLGHELAGELVEVGAAWKNKYEAGQRFTIQPALNYRGSMDSPGYSYEFCGGDATYMILPRELMEVDCLLPHTVSDHFRAALAEPYSCVIGAARGLFRTDRSSHNHYMGIRTGGSMAILGGGGPMGLAAIDYALSGPQRPAKLVVTDLDQDRLSRARRIFQPVAADRGISLFFVNPSTVDDGTPEAAERELRRISGGDGYDDILVMVPVVELLEQADRLLGFNGCLSFFAGPTDTAFCAKLNYYGVHYLEHHIIGTTGGTVDDEKEALELLEKGLTRPQALVTHVGGLNAVPGATLNLDTLPGGKKLVYPGVYLPLVALDELDQIAAGDRWYEPLAQLVSSADGLWSGEAERWLLANAPAIEEKCR
ncbi:Threonine dehydrogenase [Alkalispirochaeta americana]|uniref:Threonine dehydrogenase n=1 Tax=Alkalispirochaeta americana TaxID=159291 RepID=A0A1N6Q7V4_9SPIO|nr:alcohol dehydrogenase catalytic domain-containing protein [Alkalispirochaeta americana]SIQ12619.1 Threonine dehydrogenase [Alkalispirochaeta americana]